MSPLAGRRSALRCCVHSGWQTSAAAGLIPTHGPASNATSPLTTTTTRKPASATASATATLLSLGLRLRNQSLHGTTLHKQQSRVLQTSSSASCPAPSASSSESSTATSLYNASLPARWRRRFPHVLLARTRLRTNLPALIMGAANQTRDSSGKEPSHASNKGHGHGNAGEEDCGHSHGFLSGHHHHDTSYLVSKNRSDPGVRITNIGLVSNLAMAVAKFAGGYAFGSRAMVADAWHSVTDLASDILTLATVSWSIKSPTDRFPQGFGKVESLGALGVSSMLIVGGAYMGWESAITLFSAWNPEAAHHIMEHVGHGHSHSHSASALGIPSVHAAWLAAATIAVKEWLYYATMKVARERQSSVLASNAIHHRVDSLTGIVTLVAIIGANIFEQAAWLDPVGGLLISVMVVHAGCGNMLDSFRELVDQSIDEDVKKAVGKQARKAVANFGSSHEAELREVSGVKSGPNYLLDLEMSVPATWSIGYAREMEEAVRQRVGAKVRGAKKVRVRFVSQDEPASQKFDEFVNSAADRLGNPEPPKEEDENNSSGDEGSHKHDHKHRH